MSESAFDTELVEIDVNPSQNSAKHLLQLEKKLLHYTGKAIADFNMIQQGDRVMVCLSGGKDSFTLVRMLQLLQCRAKIHFEIVAFTLDQAQPGWNDAALR